MKNREIMNFVENINKMREKEGISFPAKVAFAITRNMKKLLPIAEDCIQTRQEVIKKYGTPVEDKPDTYSISEENAEKVNKELDNLFNFEIYDIELNKIKLSDMENVSLTIEQMDALYPMIDEE